MTEAWLDRQFGEHRLARDLTLVAFLVVFYGGVMAGAMAIVGTEFLVAVAIGLGSGVLFAVLFLAMMEVYARSQGESMFRYFGSAAE